MILYTEDQFNAAYKEYRYHHIQNKCEYLSAETFRDMFEAMIKVIYTYEVDDDER